MGRQVRDIPQQIGRAKTAKGSFGVPCNVCKAKVGEPCRTAAGQISRLHRIRRQQWRAVRSTGWPTTKTQSSHMKMRQGQNKARNVPAENWFAAKLEEAGVKMSRQAQWGYRIFDFWNHKLGVAVEIDGKTHNTEKDQKSDEVMWSRSRITVIRVENFNEEQAALAIRAIKYSKLARGWNHHRAEAGMKPVANALG